MLFSDAPFTTTGPRWDPFNKAGTDVKSRPAVGLLPLWHPAQCNLNTSNAARSSCAGGCAEREVVAKEPDNTRTPSVQMPRGLFLWSMPTFRLGNLLPNLQVAAGSALAAELGGKPLPRLSDFPSYDR